MCLFSGVHNLLKKHEAFESEMTTHEQLIHAVVSTADQLIEREHYALDEIEVRSVELQEAWAELTSLSETRHKKLQDSLVAHQVRSFRSGNGACDVLVYVWLWLCVR